MYSKELINTYMRMKNYTQQKQMASDMRISASYLSDIYRGKRNFTEESGVWIAIECNLNPEEVLMNLAAERAKTPETKNIWTQVLKRYCTGVEAAACAGLLALFYPGFDFALCGITLNIEK